VNRTMRSRHRWLWIVVVMVLLTGGWYAVCPVGPVALQPALPAHADGVP
jgi:hypothetical protein